MKDKEDCPGANIIAGFFALAYYIATIAMAFHWWCSWWGDK